MLTLFLIPLALALGTGLLALTPLLIPRARQHVWLFLSLAVLAPLLGFYAGYSQMLSHWWQAFPPIDSSRWPAFLLPIFALLGLFGTQRKIPGWLLSGLQFLWATGFAWLTLSPLREQNWGLSTQILVMLGFALCLTLYTRLLELTAETTHSAWLLISLLAISAGSSGVLFLQASTAVFMQQSWILSLLLLLPAGLLLWRKELSPRGLFTLPVFILAALWLNALLFSSASKWWPVILLLGFSPWLLQTKLLSQQSESRRQLLVLILTGIVLAIVLAIIWFSQPDPSVYWG